MSFDHFCFNITRHYPSIGASVCADTDGDGTTSANDPTAQPQIELLQNRPNPFVRQTTIGFILPENCEAQLRVFDASGRVLFSQKKIYTAGRHEETLDLEGASGVLYYELTTPFGVLAKKMVIVVP